MPVIVNDGNEVAAVTGTMGSRAQPQIQAQMLMRMLDGGQELREAVDEPRWIVGGQDEPSPRTTVLAESRATAAIERLTAAGRNVTVLPDYSDEAGHFQAITISDEGFSAATDPRSDGASAAL
jgi:gamma-glutamyltranspeptidase/glutathione hydrolase